MGGNGGRGGDGGCLASSVSPSVRILPLNGRLAVRDEVVVAGLEVSIAKEAMMGGKWRGMRRFENEVFRGINKGGFALCVGAPQEINKIVAARGKRTNDGIRERFPTLALVRASHIRAT